MVQHDSMGGQMCGGLYETNLLHSNYKRPKILCIAFWAFEVRCLNWDLMETSIVSGLLFISPQTYLYHSSVSTQSFDYLVKRVHFCCAISLLCVDCCYVHDQHIGYSSMCLPFAYCLWLVFLSWLVCHGQIQSVYVLRRYAYILTVQLHSHLAWHFFNVLFNFIVTAIRMLKSTLKDKHLRHTSSR